MKRAAIAILFVFGLIGTALFAFDYWREWTIVEKADLGFSRLDISRLQERHESAQMGSDSWSVYLYALPDEENGLLLCGTNGFSEQHMNGLDVFDIPAAPSCVRTIYAGSGTVYQFIVFADRLYVEVLA